MMNRLPRHRVSVDKCVDTGAGCGLAVCRDSGRLEQPVFAVSMPGAFSGATFRVEDPGSQFARERIPTDSLRAAHRFLPGDLNREFTQQEIAVVGRLTREIDD